MHHHRTLGLAFVLVAIGAWGASAQVPVLIDAPPPPEAPATISRDAQRRATIRAVRTAAPIRIDGRLDEDVDSVVPPAGGFIQQTPNPGAPATGGTRSISR